jgi:hypothetical protein
VPEETIDIGSQLELFVDDYLVDRMEGVTQKLHSPIPREIALHLNQPWEGPDSYDPVVIKDGDRYRMWYRAWHDEDVPLYTCYAESKDGVNWNRVTVGEVEFRGSKENNIVIDDVRMRAVCVFKDENPKTPEAERYKATGVGKAPPNWTINAMVSPDGLHWKSMQKEPIIIARRGPERYSHYMDSHNIFFWDKQRGHYVGYVRGWLYPGETRTIRRSTSADFRNWSEFQFIDMGNSPVEHLYKNACTPYFRAPHIYLMFPKRFVPDRKVVDDHPYSGVSDAVFMTSRDGQHWDRRFMEAFLRPGLDKNNWTDRNMYIGCGVMPTGPTEMSVYYVENYQHPTCRIRRGSLRIDGFVSINASYAGGEFLTKPLTFKGKRLIINYSTSAVGGIRVEIQDASGKPVTGYTLDEGTLIYGDEIEHVVTWESGLDVGSLVGQPIRLRFVMKDADLYSIHFRP